MLTKEDDYRVGLVDSIVEDLERLSMPELTRVYKFIRTHVIANIPGLQPPDSKESASAIPQQPQPAIKRDCGSCRHESEDHQRCEHPDKNGWCDAPAFQLWEARLTAGMR